jgi:hypothetical protein
MHPHPPLSKTVFWNSVLNRLPSPALCSEDQIMKQSVLDMRHLGAIKVDSNIQYVVRSVGFYHTYTHMFSPFA